MSELTRQDLIDLLDAVEVWERNEPATEIMGSMLGMMLSPDKQSREEFARREEERAKQNKGKRQAIKERSILLRAKLLMIRDAMDVDRAVNFGREGSSTP